MEEETVHEVTTYSVDAITELFAAYGDAVGGQNAINQMVQDLQVSMGQGMDRITNFEQFLLPEFQEQMEANNIALAEMRDNLAENLRQSLDQNTAAIKLLTDSIIPELKDDLEDTAEQVRDSPKSYYSSTAPTNPDETGRPLVVGDSWYDEDDSNKAYTWNGVEWTTFTVDVGDISVSVGNLKTATHMIY